VPRPLAETDRSLKQIIPYLVLRDGDRVFLMKRTRAGGDARLHDLYTVGVGGHLNPGDGGILGGLAREWSEELEADFVPDFEFVGLLNDDTVDVGLHHLGVVYVADAAGRPVRIRETQKLSGSFERLDFVLGVYDRMETWSQLALDAMVGANLGPQPGVRGADRDGTE
jgi:predicted NUDIX family phosphoesterase